MRPGFQTSLAYFCRARSQIDPRFFASLRMTLWPCEAIGEFPQKWFHVRDDGCCSTTRSTAEGINIDAYDFHGGREHAHHRKRMPDGRQQQRVRHVGEFFAQHFLALNRVCRCAGNRSLIPNRAGEYHIDIVRTQACMIPLVRRFFSTAAAMLPTWRIALIARITFSRPPRANARSRLMPKEVPNNARSTS